MDASGVQVDALARWRAPLLAAVAFIAAIDFIGLGTRFAPRSTPEPLTGPRSSGGSSTGASIVIPPFGNTPDELVMAPFGPTTSISSREVRPTVLSLDGAPGPAIVTPPTPPGGTGEIPTAPVGQASVAVPALDSHATVGAGDASCTGADLTLLAYGDCPAPSGEGPVVVQTGGSAVPA